MHLIQILIVSFYFGRYIVEFRCVSLLTVFAMVLYVVSNLLLLDVFLYENLL